MGRKQHSYWTVHYKYLGLSSHMWCSIELLDHPVVIKDNMCLPQRWTLVSGVLEVWWVLKQFSHFTVSSSAVDKPCDQIDQLDQLLTNFSPTFPNWTNLPLTIFWTTFDHLSTNFSPTWPTSDQLFTNLTSPRPNSPTSQTSHQLFANFTEFAKFSQTWPNRPTFHQLA